MISSSSLFFTSHRNFDSLQDDSKIREALGIDRVIWIDDVFGDPAIDLAILARGQPSLQDDFEELRPAYVLEGYGDVDAELTQIIRDLADDRRSELREKLLQKDAEDAPAPELPASVIESACNELGVAVEDRWTFQQAVSNLTENLVDDAAIAFVIDLKESGGPDQRGLEIIAQLRAIGSIGVAFILTHEASAAAEDAQDSEAAIEKKLAHDIGALAGLAPPITVISKGRLTNEDSNLETAFAVALKRAGLRRALHQVLTAASGRAAEAYILTAAALLEIEPERLEQYVFEQGRREGVSELNVVERALSAGASKAMRTFFGTDAVVLRAIQSLRALQSVALDDKALDAGPTLANLRDAEVWDEGGLLNAAETPLANGDVFRFDEAEPNGPKSPRLFVLLGQPCDIALRADGSRVSEAAMLVPLIELEENGVPVPDPNDPDEDEKIKVPELPFRLKGKRFKLDLRRIAYVRLDILDLTCFRSDGCVRVEDGHGPHPAMLAGAKVIYKQRTAAADDALGKPAPAPAAPGTRLPLDDRLLLTMSQGKPWDGMRVGKRIGAFAVAGHHLQLIPERITWFVRRDGRIRPPFSAFLLERTFRTLGRRAFDSDFTTD